MNHVRSDIMESKRTYLYSYSPKSSRQRGKAPQNESRLREITTIWSAGQNTEQVVVVKRSVQVKSVGFERLKYNESGYSS